MPFTTDNIHLNDSVNSNQHVLAVSGNVLTLDGSLIQGGGGGGGGGTIASLSGYYLRQINNIYTSNVISNSTASFATGLALQFQNPPLSNSLVKISTSARGSTSDYTNSVCYLTHFRDNSNLYLTSPSNAAIALWCANQYDPGNGFFYSLDSGLFTGNNPIYSLQFISSSSSNAAYLNRRQYDTTYFGITELIIEEYATGVSSVSTSTITGITILPASINYNPNNPPIQNINAQNDEFTGILFNTGLWTTYNLLGGTTITQKNSLCIFNCPSNGGDDCNFIAQPTPSGNWSLTTKFNYLTNGVAYPSVNLSLLDNSTTKMINMGSYLDNSNNRQLVIQHWNSPTSYNSTSYTIPLNTYSPIDFYFRIRNSGSNLYFDVSEDGASFINLYSESSTAWLSTINSGAFAVNPNNHNTIANIDWFRWNWDSNDSVLPNQSPIVSVTGLTNPLLISKAWATWSGTSTGAVILSSYNISGITRNGQGDYTYWFSGVMNDANYAVTFGGRSNPASNYGQYEQHDSPYRTVSGLRVYTTANWNTNDLPINSAVFFGN